MGAVRKRLSFIRRTPLRTCGMMRAERLRLQLPVGNGVEREEWSAVHMITHAGSTNSVMIISPVQRAKRTDKKEPSNTYIRIDTNTRLRESQKHQQPTNPPTFSFPGAALGCAGRGERGSIICTAHLLLLEAGTRRVQEIREQNRRSHTFQLLQAEAVSSPPTLPC